MLRIATINTRDTHLDDHATFEALVSRLQAHQFDILCCQDVPAPTDKKSFSVVMLAEALGMTCSFTASPKKKKAKKTKLARKRLGKAILTGQDCCMLSSGLITLPEAPRKKSNVQFAVVRKDGDAVLICNMQLTARNNVSVQRQQLQPLFSHHIMEKQYAAIVFCGEFGGETKGKKVNLLHKKSHYIMREGVSLVGKSGQSSPLSRIYVLEDKKEPVATIQFTNACCLAGNSSQSPERTMIEGTSLDLKLSRIQHNDASQIHRYVSFLRPWTGPAEAEQGAAFQPAWLGHSGSLGLANITGC